MSLIKFYFAFAATNALDVVLRGQLRILYIYHKTKKAAFLQPFGNKPYYSDINIFPSRTTNTSPLSK